MGDRNSIFYAHETLQEYSKITKEVVSSKAFPLVSDDFLNLNLVHTELREFIETLFTYATGIASKLKDASKPNDKHLEKLILKFINKNYLILKQFILDEIFFQGFLRSLSFNNDFILK